MPDRIIRESICTSETLNQLSDFEERFWNRLIVNCDDYGRFDARPAILKGRLFPLMDGKTNKDMTNALSRLASAGLVELYQVDGKPFLRVVKWDKYQRIRAKRSKFPAPVDTCRQMTASDGKCPRNPIQSESNPNPNADAECARGYGLAAVMNAYMNRIDPTPAPSSMDELKGYVDLMGAECCIRAIDAALNAKAANWNYVRRVLMNKASQGVRCIADWDAVEAKREAAKKAPAMQDHAAAPGEVDQRVREDLERMREFMRRQHEEDGNDGGGGEIA